MHHQSAGPNKQGLDPKCWHERSGVIHGLRKGGINESRLILADESAVFEDQAASADRHAGQSARRRPFAFMLTGKQVADCTAGEVLLERLPDCDILRADKGYDANAIRQQVERRGTMPNIPPKANRKWKNCFSPFLYRNRNAIERMFCRLKDFRRVATRYDRNAVNFLAAICIAAAVGYWL